MWFFDVFEGLGEFGKVHQFIHVSTSILVDFGCSLKRWFLVGTNYRLWWLWPLLKYTCNYVSASFCQFFIWSLEFFKNCSRHIAQRWGWVQMSGEVCMGMWWWHVGHGTHWWYATEEGPWRCAGREHLRLVGLKHELVQPQYAPTGKNIFSWEVAIWIP